MKIAKFTLQRATARARSGLIGPLPWGIAL
jgi:hypothetical protein